MSGSPPAGGSRDASSSAWILAALLPALGDSTWQARLAWSGALLVGAAVGGALPVRWIAVAWAAAAVAPEAGVLPIASGGLLGGRWRGVLAAALAAPLLAAVVPVPFRTAGFLLLAAAAILALHRTDR